MSYRIVFSDIDGTFLNSRHEVMPETEQAVKRLLQRQIPFVLVSARMPEAITPITGKSGIKIPWSAQAGRW